MNKQIMLAIIIVSLISCASAINVVIAGESININVTEQYDSYSIVGNSTPISLDVEQEGLIITVTFNKYQKEDTFELIFFNKEKEVIKEVPVNSGGGGGGGSHTIYKDNNITEYVYRDRDVEKIVEVTDEEETNRLLGLANDSAKREYIWKILFIVVFSFILIVIVLKLILGDRI